MPARALMTLWREGGVSGITRKLSATVRMTAPLVLRGRRTGAGTGAYFDLVTDDTRLFYGDNFHFGYFPTGEETLAQAHNAHTDLVASLAQLSPGQHVLDIGCGIGAPAVRMARNHGCHVTGINISREQIRQGTQMIEQEGMSEQVAIQFGDARSLPFADGSFDAIVCVEVAGDICVTEQDKHTLVSEMLRVLRPGGLVGFSDLALHTAPSKQERRVLRAVFYDNGEGLVSDWAGIFQAHGFAVSDDRSIIEQTLPTWQRVHEIYSGADSELARRYGNWIAKRTCKQIERVPEILSRLGTFPVLAARKPMERAPVAEPALRDAAPA
jgi:cyclopropane fatty-acyl-phospholipid synthase-like methyltransferase